MICQTSQPFCTTSGIGDGVLESTKAGSRPEGWEQLGVGKRRGTAGQDGRMVREMWWGVRRARQGEEEENPAAMKNFQKGQAAQAAVAGAPWAG